MWIAPSKQASYVVFVECQAIPLIQSDLNVSPLNKLIRIQKQETSLPGIIISIISLAAL